MHEVEFEAVLGQMPVESASWPPTLMETRWLSATPGTVVHVSVVCAARPAPCTHGIGTLSALADMTPKVRSVPVGPPYVTTMP